MFCFVFVLFCFVCLFFVFWGGVVCFWLVACLTTQQHATACSDNCACCHTEIEVAYQTFHPTQSQYTDTGPISHRADPLTPGVWQSNHWSANFKSIVRLDREKSRRKRDSNPASSALEADALTTRPMRLSMPSPRESLHENMGTSGNSVTDGETRGVMVSTSAFLACHQCYCAGSSLAWGLNLLM